MGSVPTVASQCGRSSHSRTTLDLDNSRRNVLNSPSLVPATWVVLIERCYVIHKELMLHRMDGVHLTQVGLDLWNLAIKTSLEKALVCAQLFVCLIIFYIVFYGTCSVCTGAMRIEHFNWKIPFDHQTVPDFNNTDFLVHLISLGTTCFLSGLLFVPIGRSWVWDYALTVIILHICICCIVTGAFPLIWQWWLEIGCGLILIVGCGQTVAYFTVGYPPRKSLRSHALLIS
ncbi:putative transmembrane protein 244 [Pelodytes ibericus]